jgi:DNA-binding phage protein
MSDLTALDALEEVFQEGYILHGESLERLREIREEILANGDALTKADKERLELLNQMIILEERREMLRQKEANEENLRLRGAEARVNASREEMLFLLRATDAQKKLYEIQKQQQELLGGGFGANGLFGPAGFLDMAADMLLNMEFLKAQEALLMKELQDTRKTPQAQGGLAQDPFDAQAQALEQIFAAMSEKPDPQLRAIEDVLKAIRQAIAQGGGLIKVVP